MKDHPWFLNVNWGVLAKKRYKPPFVPTLKSMGDTSNFDREFTEIAVDTPDGNQFSDAIAPVYYANFTFDGHEKK